MPSSPVELGRVNLTVLARRIPPPAGGRSHVQLEAVVIAPPEVVQRTDSVPTGRAGRRRR